MPSLEEIRRHLDMPADSSKSLVAAASQLLSNITHLAGVVTLPLAQAAALTQIEFLALSENRVLVVLVLNDREVQNRIIQLERHYSAEELRRAANFLNEHCVGRTLPQIHQELVHQLKETHENLNQVMLDAIAMAQRLFEQGSASRGHRVRDRRRDQSDGLRRARRASRSSSACSRPSTRSATSCTCSTRACGPKGVQIFIGQESGYQILDDYSVVTAPYSSGQGRGRRAGRHRPDAHGL